MQFILDTMQPFKLFFVHTKQKVLGDIQKQPQLCQNNSENYILHKSAHIYRDLDAGWRPYKYLGNTEDVTCDFGY